eukprot:5581884-Pleurochrysis_carterae.AAC.1
MPRIGISLQIPSFSHGPGVSLWPASAAKLWPFLLVRSCTALFSPPFFPTTFSIMQISANAILLLSPWQLHLAAGRGTLWANVLRGLWLHQKPNALTA